ncbi:MAG: hypothetical protein QM640_10885 [Niabella sp.]
MKLIFSKNANNEIDIKYQNGTIVEDFSYTEMVKQLLAYNKFEDTDFGTLTAEEQGKINLMLEKISAVFEEEKSKEID